MLQLKFPVTIPKPVEAGGEGNGPLYVLVLGDQNDVGVAKLSGKQSCSFHLSEQLSQSFNRRVRKMSQEVIRNPVWPCRFVWQPLHHFVENDSVQRREGGGLCLSSPLEFLESSNVRRPLAELPKSSPLLFSCSESLCGRHILKGSLPRMILLSETAEESSKSLLVSLLQPFAKFMVGGAEKLLLGQVLFVLDGLTQLTEVRLRVV